MDILRQSANKAWKHKHQQTPASEEINKKLSREKNYTQKSNQIVSTADANQRQPSKLSVRLFVFDLFGNKLNASKISYATLLLLLSCCVMLEKVFTVITYIQRKQKLCKND